MVGLCSDRCRVQGSGFGSLRTPAAGRSGWYDLLSRVRDRASRCQRDMTLDEVGKECIIVLITAPKVWRDRTKEEEGNLVTGPTEISPTRQACTTLVPKGDQGSPSLVLPPVLSRLVPKGDQGSPSLVLPPVLSRRSCDTLHHRLTP